MITMFDSVNAGMLPPGYAYAGYVDGIFRDYGQITALFPGADVLSIAVFAADDADCLDVETGDASPGQAAGWAARQAARGVARPCLYAAVSTMSQVIAALTAAGVSRSGVRLWSAHYGAGEHICGPSTCGLITVPMDGTQWTDVADGKNLDQSLLLPDFFAGPPARSRSYLTPLEMDAIMNALPELQLGDADRAGEILFVHRMQNGISGIGAWNGLNGTAIAADGVFGPLTEAALRTVQGFFGITQDGICGPQTWEKLVAG